MSRADNLILNKKKKKKIAKVNENLENEVKVLSEANERLLGRESALLEAVSRFMNGMCCHNHSFIWVYHLD